MLEFHLQDSGLRFGEFRDLELTSNANSLQGSRLRSELPSIRH